MKPAYWRSRMRDRRVGVKGNRRCVHCFNTSKNSCHVDRIIHDRIRKQGGVRQIVVYGEVAD